MGRTTVDGLAYTHGGAMLDMGDSTPSVRLTARPLRPARRSHGLTRAATLAAWLSVCASAIAGGKPVRTGPDPRRVNEALNLAGSQVVSVNVAPAAIAADTISVTLPIEGQPMVISLSPHSNRADIYRVLVQVADGSYLPFESDAPTTLRGEIEGLEGSAVAATQTDLGLEALIILPDDSRYWLQPVPSAIAGASNAHVLYRDEDVLEGDACAGHGPAHDHDGDIQTGKVQEPFDGGVAGTAGLFITELAIDADVDYFNDYGSVAAVEAQINSVINTVNVQYERDVSIRHVITTIIVRTAEPDPYTTNNAESLLQQFRTHWLTVQTGVQRDLAQLFTGKTLVDNNGLSGVIGIAWVGEAGTTTVCGQYGYSVVDSNCIGACSSFAAKTDLSAHELGHNWGAQHCCCDGRNASCPLSTMNPLITGANVFSAGSISQITAYRDTRSCLQVGDELRRLIVTAPSTSFFESGTLQLTAIADFRYGPDENVTTFTGWTINRGSGFVSPSGVFNPFDVDGDVCETIVGFFEYNGVLRSDDVSFVVRDIQSPQAIVAGDPPIGAIDARQPSDPQATVGFGWNVFDITLNGEVCAAVPADFTVIEDGGGAPTPAVTNVQQLSATNFRLTLNQFIEPGAWTEIRHNPTGASMFVGFLPGDVNSDGTTNATDVAALAAFLGGQGASLPPWATDLDRSGTTTPADLVRLIDLMNGAEWFIDWNGFSLPQDE